jgi:hypothetical protein
MAENQSGEHYVVFKPVLSNQFLAPRFEEIEASTVVDILRRCAGQRFTYIGMSNSQAAI